MKRFCPRCGADENSKEKDFIKGFCVDCFLHDHPHLVSLPKTTKIKQCPSCESLWFRGTWVPKTPDNMRKMMESKLKTRLENAAISELLEVAGEENTYEFTVKGQLEHLPVMVRKKVDLKFDRSEQCLVCARMQSTYHEALVQLRFKKQDNIEPKGMKEVVEFIKNSAQEMSGKQRMALAMRVEERKEGIDVFISSQKVARHVISYLVNTYSPEIRESWTLVGLDKDSGKRRYRATYSVRL